MPRQNAKDKEYELRRWMETPVLLTPEGHRRLKEKLAHLKKILPGLIEETARTAAYGDRSDNAEYADAKGRLRRTQAQIFRIEDELKRVQIITAGAGRGGKVQLGSVVTIESSGRQKTFRIVGPQETNPGAGFISNASPLGAALLGRTKGEIIKVETAGGGREYHILDIA